MPGTGVQGEYSPRKSLRQLIEQWKDLRLRIDEILDDPGAELTQATQLDKLRDKRVSVVDNIQALVRANKGLYDEAVEWGFRQDLLPKGAEPPNTGGPPGEQAGPPVPDDDKDPPKDDAERNRDKDRGNPDLRDETQNRLGRKGQDYIIVKHHGEQFALYTYNVSGNTIEVRLHIPKGQEAKYGVKPGEGHVISDKRWKDSELIGSADEMPLGKLPKDAIKETQRYLERVYGTSAVTKDDDVMAVFIGAEMLGWSGEEIAGQLRETQWFNDSTEYERQYVRDYSDEQRDEQKRNTRVEVISGLENLYGAEWKRHLREQGLDPSKAIDDWVNRIASGEMGGDPGRGLELLLSRQNMKARDLEGTPAWMNWQQEQEAVRDFANRPEDKFEQLRTQALNYLGQDRNDTPRVSRDVLMSWASDLVTGKKSEGDWAQYLRDQMKILYPYFDANRSFREQADPYKSALENVLGSPVGYDHRLLTDLASRDGQGRPTDKAMSMAEWNDIIRDPNKNRAAYKQGTPLFEQGMDRLSEVLFRMRGVA